MASRNVFNTFTVAARSVYLHKWTNLKEMQLELLHCFVFHRKRVMSGNILKLSRVSRTTTAELHLSGLNGTARHPNMQKIRTTDFSLKTGYFGSLKWKRMSKNCYFTLHIYLCTNKTLIHNFLYVFDNWRGKKFKPHKRYTTIRIRKRLPIGSSRSG